MPWLILCIGSKILCHSPPPMNYSKVPIHKIISLAPPYYNKISAFGKFRSFRLDCLASPPLLFNLLFCLFIKFTLNKRVSFSSFLSCLLLFPFSLLENSSLSHSVEHSKAPLLFVSFSALALPCGSPHYTISAGFPFPFLARKKRN